MDPALIQSLRHANCCITINRVVENGEPENPVYISPGPFWKIFSITAPSADASAEDTQAREEFLGDIDSLNAADFNSKYGDGFPSFVQISRQ
jgi:hypothetical protein